MMTLILGIVPRRLVCSAYVSSSTSSFTRSFVGTQSGVRSYSKSSLNMKLQTAIVGLPNVGKSTLFNALTETQGEF